VRVLPGYKLKHYDTQTLQTKTIDCCPLKGESVSCIAFDGNGILATALTGITLWDIHTGKPIRDILGQTRVHQMVFNGNGLLASNAINEKIIKVFDIYTGNILANIDTPHMTNMVIFLKNDLIATATIKGGIKIWEMPNDSNQYQHRCVDTICEDSRNDSLVAFDGNDRLATSVAYEETVIWELSTKSRLVKLKLPEILDTIKSIIFGDNGLVATSHYRGNTRLWDVSTGSCINKFHNWCYGSNISSHIFFGKENTLMVGDHMGLVVWKYC